MSLTASRPDWRVKVRKGDTLGIGSTYESAQGSWYESMGIVLLFMARAGRASTRSARRSTGAAR